jgi:excinuclease ABC B subunit
LEIGETTKLQLGDWLPLPAKIPAPATPVGSYAVAPALVGRGLYVTGPSVDPAWPHGVRRSLRHGLRVPLESVGSAGVATMERFGPTLITSRSGNGSLPASRPMDAEWLRFLGLFVAEGHVADTYATLTPGPEGLALARELAATCGLRHFERPSGELVFAVKATVETLRTLCGSKAAAKHLPPFWASLDDPALGALLAGYFEGDGWNETRRGAVSAVTKSKRLASELSYALLRLGIQARLFPTWKRAVGTAHQGDTYWRVDVRGAEDLATFERVVGFVGPRKRTELRATVDAAVGGNADCLPEAANDAVRRARMALGMLQRDLAHTGCTRASVSLIEGGRRRLRRDHARSFVRAFRESLTARPSEAGEQATQEIERLLACRWARVASVESGPTTATHVYDLSVESSETFLAGFGGLIVHNTYSMAKVIERIQRPTLVLAHNKTLAAQLYAEFRDFFPNNAVEYFVSYFDYYQPEAYLPRSDTYIEKDSSRNEEIDKLRHAATKALFERRDVIIVASVSCIYGLGAPVDYGATVLRLKIGGRYRRDAVLRHLVDLQYQRNDQALQRSRFRVRGDTLELVPASEDRLVRVEFFGDEIERITELDSLTGELIAERSEVNVYPATHYVTPADKLQLAMQTIAAELEERLTGLEAEGRALEAARLRQRTTFDLEMMRELGYCSGIENYSRHLSGREPGSRPWTLLDYFPPDWLLVVDESHMSIPQVVGMYKNDRTRKEILVDFGFRLPSALDNRPLTFEEFERTINQAVYVSATPGPYELEKSQRVVEQLIRPTGIVDPGITIRPTEGQIDDLLERIRERVERGERAIVTTLTKRLAEDLTDYLRELGVKVQYLHSEVDTLDRIQILRDLRLGIHDVVVGINLLREGIDLPEVTLVAILDADKEGFLRSAWSLIQMIGRAARNTGGEVVMYADRVTESMRAAIEETDRRRAAQQRYNVEHGITPITIVREIHDLNDRLRVAAEASGEYEAGGRGHELEGRTRRQVEELVVRLEADMRLAAKNLEFERAATLRDQVQEIRLRVLAEDASISVGRAAERAGVGETGGIAPGGQGSRVGRAGRPGSRRGSGRPETAEAGPGLEVTAVRVVEAGEEPGGEPGVDEGTASDWLPGLRDEHEDAADGGWQARWLDRPTWDHTVTPNVRRRTGRRPPRR